jgi:hypothetical protein
VKYAMPEKMAFHRLNTGGGIDEMDYDQTGTPRAYLGTASGATGGQASGAGGGMAAPQIQVNVQAMDSKSFLDHSNEIAQAVRTAMLNLSSINDVVSDL